VTVTILPPTSLEFEWSPPSEEERNGPLTGYRLVLEWEVGQEDRVDTSETNYTFTGLQEGTTYTCSIAAHTSIGIGPYHNIIITLPSATTSGPRDISTGTPDKDSIIRTKAEPGVTLPFTLH
jgi:receptor-type tyrosine-protein phosphatase Q